MRKEKKAYISNISSIILLIITYIIFSRAITGNDTLENIILSILPLFIAIFVNRIIHSVIKRYETIVRKKRLPMIFHTATTIVIYLIAILFILSGVWEKDISLMFVSGGVIATGFAVALKNEIDNAFSSISNDIEGTYMKGEYLQLLSTDKIAKILSSNWRSVKFILQDDSILILPHNKVNGDGFINLSRPNKVVRFSFDITLSFELPVSNAVKMLKDTVLTFPNISKYKEPFIEVKEIIQEGVIYSIFLFHENPFEFRILKSNIYKRIWKNFKFYNIDSCFDNIPTYNILQNAPEKSYSSFNMPTKVIIKNIDLFEALSEKEIETLGKNCNRKIYEIGEPIIKQNEKGSSMFIITQGVVDVCVAEKKGEIIVANLGLGDFFGDIALLTGEKRNATVRAKTEVTVLEIDKAHLLPIILKRPQLAENFSELVIQRQAKTEQAKQDFKKKRKDIKNRSLSLASRIKSFFGI